MLDVCICTHDPRREVLDLTLRSLAAQAVAPGAFDVLVVDNASTPALGEDVLAPLRARGIAARLVREERPGLAQARVCAIRETGRPWLLFLDDDNELAEGFVAEGLRFLASRPDLGCFGGKLLLPAHLEPPRWSRPFLPYLAIKDAGDAVLTGASLRWGEWEPPGAGVFVRREVLEAYRARVERDPAALRLGRRGRGGLACGEDSLMARQCVGLGLVNAYDPRLSLTHHLDASRFRLRYLLRLMRAYGSSHVLLESLLRPEGERAEIPACYRRPYPFLRLLLRELDAGRKKSLAFALGRIAYQWSVRKAYLAGER